MPLYERLSQRFEVFAEMQAREASPLYERLARCAAREPDVLALAAESRQGQPPPNLLFGAVHFLLLSGAAHPLGAHFATTAGSMPESDSAPEVDFLDFCRRYAEEISTLVRTRSTQTNEVFRSTLLAVCFDWIARQYPVPLSLIEVGPSAGLNLNWDRYTYRLGSRTRIVPRTAPARGDEPLVLKAALKGSRAPPLAVEGKTTHHIDMAMRIGIEKEPVDLNNPDAVRWLAALIWPDHLDRFAAFHKAVEIARQHPPTITRGDAIDRLPDLIAASPADSLPVVYHTIAVYQLDPDRRAQLAGRLRSAASSRPVLRLSIEWIGTPTPVMEVDRFKGGAWERIFLGLCSPHGRWIRWAAD